MKTGYQFPRKFICWILISISIGVWGTCSLAATPNNPPDYLIPCLTPKEPLNLNPLITQWLYLDGELNALSLIDGKIVIYLQNDTGVWEEKQRFGPEDINFTTFQARDINNDGSPEIVAGTVEPGFIYIYKLTDGAWELNSYGKYVWSRITNITVGNFSSAKSNDILVQNQEGSLFLLKKTENTIDLIWKSPKAWRPITLMQVLDLDNDSKEEIIVAYRTGGIGILRVQNNSIVSVWENYLWGKILGTAFGDWDHDNLPELMFSTSQKVVYLLGYRKEAGFQFEGLPFKFEFIIEKLVIMNIQGKNQLLATDTAGKTHLMEYVLKTKEWQEKFLCQTGRIAMILIEPELKEIYLWGANRSFITLEICKPETVKLQYRDDLFDLKPTVLFQNNHFYLAPRSFQGIPELLFSYDFKDSIYRIGLGETVLEIPKNKPENMTINGEVAPFTDQVMPIVINDILYLPLESYQKLWNINVVWNQLEKSIKIIEAEPEKEASDSYSES